MKMLFNSICVLMSLFFAQVSFGAIPESLHQYAADGEYADLLILPWSDGKAGDPSIGFRYPSCFGKQEVSERYAGSMLFNGVLKMAGGNVVAMISVCKFGGTEELQAELKILSAATDAEIASPLFIRSIASLAGRKDVVETGGAKVSGKNAFWCTARMERRLRNQVGYRGVQRTYIIPLEGGKRIVSANFGVGVLGVDEFPYSDFHAFLPVGEKFIRSLTINEKKKWKFW